MNRAPQVLDRLWAQRTAVETALLTLSAVCLAGSALVRLASPDLAARLNALQLAGLLHQLAPDAAEAAYRSALRSVLEHLYPTALLFVGGLFDAGVVLCITRRLRDPDPLGLPLMVAGLLGVLALLTTWAGAPVWSSLLLVLQASFVAVGTETLRRSHVPPPEP